MTALTKVEMPRKVVATMEAKASIAEPDAPTVAPSAPAVEKPKPTPTRKRIIEAVKLKDHAASHKRWADHKARSGDRIGALMTHHDADQMRESADKELNRWNYATRNRQPGNGGELVPLFEPEDTYRRDYKRMTVEELPDALEHQASSDAMNLAAKADVLPLALEMANSIKAKNRAEKLLAHQAVTMHTLGMNLVARAQNEIDRANGHALSGNVQWRQVANVEAARATNAAARAMSAFNDAMLTLQKLRTGGKQVVQVQHVTVKEGGQAVVGQNVKSAKRGGGRKRGGLGRKS